MKAWETLYKGHEVRVEYGVFTKRLFIDGELHAGHSGLGSGIELLTRIRRGNGIGEPVIARFQGLWQPKCELLVNDSHLELTKQNNGSS